MGSALAAVTPSTVPVTSSSNPAPLTNGYAPPGVAVTSGAMATKPAPVPVTNAYSPPVMTGTKDGMSAKAAAVPVANDYGPPGGSASSSGMGTKAAFAVDTGGYEPPILTPTGVARATARGATPNAPPRANPPYYGDPSQ
jgi:hypothetical protein